MREIAYLTKNAIEWNFENIPAKNQVDLPNPPKKFIRWSFEAHRLS